MAAPTKNSAPITALSRTLTGRAWNSKPPIAPGQSQHMAPVTEKTMASILIDTCGPRPRRISAPFRFPANGIFRSTSD